MKTCKKTLGLVLVFALVMSLFAVSASADFTDQSDITNDEAAVVLTALGVIDGFEDGSFQPDTVLTREQAAAIIARMLLGDSADSLTAGSAPFSDVASDRWSAGYIAYCVSKGIVDGFEDGSFRPEDNLTCYQFAKMLLVALGYDAETENLTGASWAINASSYAINAGIFDDVASWSGDCDRDTAALMALNTLKADLVYYPNGGAVIENGDSTIIINGSSATRVENNGSTDGNIDLDEYMQFAERYFTKLELTESAEGVYGRPATFTWELNGDVIYTGADESNLVETWTGYVTKGELYSAIGSTVYGDITDSDDSEANLYVYVDGAPFDGGDAMIDANDVDDFIERSSSGYTKYSSGEYLTGRGVITELYVTDSNDVYLVVINTYLAIAQDDYDESDGTLDVLYYSELNEPDTDHDITLEDDSFDISGYVADDYLLLTFDNGEVETAESATVVSGTVTGYTNESSITVDGTRYYFAANLDEGEFEDSNFTVNSEITLVLDDTGYIVGHGDAASSSNYLYVLEIAKTGSLSSSGYEAAVIFSDGTYDEITLRYIDGESPTSDDLATTGWFRYTVNSSNRYSLTMAATGLVEEEEGDDVEVRNGSARYLTNDGAVDRSFTATGSTVFVVYNNDDNDFDVYTGYNNVPDVAQSGSRNAVSVSALTNSSGYSVAVMIFVDDDMSVTGGGGTSSDFILVYSGASVSADSEGNTYFSHDAFVNGEPTTVDSANELEAGHLYTDISYDENGYIDEADDLGTSNVLDNDEYIIVHWGDGGKPSITYSSGVITMGKDGVLPLAGSYDIYLVDLETGDYKSVTASRFAGKYDGEIANAVYVYGVYDDDGSIVTLYVVSDGILG